MARCVYLCRVAGKCYSMWQVTIRSSAVGNEFFVQSYKLLYRFFIDVGKLTLMIS